MLSPRRVATRLEPIVVVVQSPSNELGCAGGRIESRLEELGVTLPEPLVSPGTFQLVKVHDGLADIAGHGLAGRWSTARSLVSGHVPVGATP